MVKIRVTCGGCGIEYIDEHGKQRHMLKTAENGPFECDEEQAERLVRLEVAEYVNAKEVDIAWENDDEQHSGIEQELKNGHLSAEELKEWDFNDLRELAADMGVKPKGKKKVDYIDAIVAEEVEIGNRETEDDEFEKPEVADPE